MGKILKLGIPKGSLQNATIDLFRRSGWKINVEGRSYFPDIDDETIECALCRAQEMSINVETGVIDAGLTGLDWVAEHESDVHVVTDLVYSKVSARPARWVVAVASESPIQTLADLEGKTISTELVKFTRRFFKERHINVTVKFSWGATEAKIVSGLADAIVEITETESTIRAHNLRVIHEVMATNTQLIANKKGLGGSRQKGENRADRPAAPGGACGGPDGGHQNECAGKEDRQDCVSAAQSQCTHHCLAVPVRLVFGGKHH